MENKVLKKHCFIRKDGFLYCSKCGKRQLQDQYNMERHAKECKFSKYDLIQDYNEDKDYTYAFKISEDNSKLLFFVYTPKLVLRPGFKDRYSGGEWSVVFKAAFLKNSTKVLEKGEYNIDFWFKYCLDNEKMKSLGKDEDFILFKNFFTDVIGFDSYGSFLDLYRNNGYGSYKPFSDEEANSLLENKSFVYTPNYRYVQYSVCGELIHYNDDLIFHIEVYENGVNNIFSVLISKNYLYTTNENSNDLMHKLINNIDSQQISNDIPDEYLKEFDEKYPSFMICNYLNCHGNNILIPLLSSTYSKCIELLYKAGMPILAENFEKVKKNNELVLYKNNIKDIFGMPVKTIKRVLSAQIINEKNIFNHLKDIFEYDKRYLSLQDYPLTVLNFLKYQNITHKKDFVVDHLTIKELNKWDNEELYQTFKYLYALDHKQSLTSYGFNSQWTQYKDYIETSVKLKDFVYGRRPKDLSIAHDMVMDMYLLKTNTESELRFKDAISLDDYKRLSTSFNLHSDLFKDDKYVIVLPKRSTDLINESTQMHNCVKTYIDKVSNNKTYILFLRDKLDINKSLCTIEVSTNLKLIQLKAFGNSKANQEIQDFVKKWAKIKHIDSNCYDIY